MRMKDFDGMFFSLATEEELDEMMRMTKAELSKLYVQWQVKSGSINPPASYKDQEEYVARTQRKPELIDGILMMRDFASQNDVHSDDDEKSDFVQFSELPHDEQIEVAIRIAALAIMDGISTYQDMMDEAESIARQFWTRYRSIDENPGMWSGYRACVLAASCVEQYWLAVNHEALGYRYDDRMESFFVRIKAVIDEIEAAHNDDDAKQLVTFRFWPESQTPIAMTLDESDAMRATGAYDSDPLLVAKTFADEWRHEECPEADPDTLSGIDETLRMYAAEYEDLSTECGEAYTPDEVAEMLYEQVDQMTSQWTDEDEKALDEFASLLVYDDDDVDDLDDIVDEWTEWLVLAGELDRIDTCDDDSSSSVWAWCPDHRAEIPGSDRPMRSFSDAKKVFDSIDPMGHWFSRRYAEVTSGEEPNLARRFEVDLVCQTCTLHHDGLISVRDDAVRLSKDFDVEGDKAAQALISSILSYI